MLNVFMLNVFMLNVFMLNVFMLNVFMLNVFMLNVFMLRVAFFCCNPEHCCRDKEIKMDLIFKMYFFNSRVTPVAGSAKSVRTSSLCWTSSPARCQCHKNLFFFATVAEAKIS
jgi:hypothetical protein